jgi:hypothetical protein
MRCLQDSLSLALVFQARVPSNTTASSLTPSSHLFLGFPILNNLTFHAPKFMFCCLCHSRRRALFLSLSQACHEVSKQYDTFLRGEVVSPTPNPQPGGPGYFFFSGSSLLTCLALETLPVATLPPAHLSGSFDHASPTTPSK